MENCPNVKYFFIPDTVSSPSQLPDNLLFGTDISYVVFTSYIDKTELETRIKNTNCFGLSKNCSVELADGTICLYNVTTNSLSDGGKFDISGHVRALKSITSGKIPSLNLGKMSYFSSEHVNYCISNKIPFITIYHDSKTSASSRVFYEKTMKNAEFKKKLSELKCPIFMLDR